MALMPGTQWRPLGPNPAIEGSIARYDILCYHTMVGSLWGTDNYFKQDGYGGAESHFGVGYDGEILQWQDTRYRADANLDGGDRVLSVETADMGTGFPAWSGSNVPAWTAAQIEANAQIAAWVHLTHGIPLVLIPNSAQSSRGIGYHRQGVDPWRCDTCERWSNAYGKVCPGDRRIAQLPQVINRAQQIVTGDDMTPEECKTAMREVLAEQRIRLDWDGQDVSFYQALSWIHFNAADGSFVGTVPATSTRANRRGTDTFGKQVLDQPTAEVDAEALAAELAPLLPGCSQEAVEAALRAVLGSLDETPAPPPVSPENP